MIDPQQVEDARRALGVGLGQRRRSRGLTQADVAERVYSTRSTIAGVERGQQVADRVFWRRCDRLLEAGGELLAGYDGYRDLKQRFDQERIEARQRARWGEVDDGSPQALVDVPVAGGLPSSGTVATTALADPSGGSPAPGLGGGSASVSVDPAMALHWEEMLRLLAASHNVLGSRQVYGLSAES
ncbi:helix-turn-helix domain-containing protein [Verrucosispora sioxanthis]|uniref:Helix-turn-helix domain-containing protein n=1 Tax=Verrucosispora sioxanthis TaxID=2499994 RepID=A0A6M1L9Q9_9ACTN|nr:helix-turn-helix transcriptional regulator [Verrucosispora sioxanthis]NEE65901.1 helix-turn-helix domain-containing protein [Verrucosispora sioxanthis]NGM15011.1 helix-turn-helix domain-containing protein [Verrucosispora sioxanthis]